MRGPRRAGDEWVSESCLTSVIEMEAHSHVRAIESNDEGAIAYMLGCCLKREGATRFVDTTNDIGRVLSTRAVSVSLAIYMFFSNWMASVPVKVQSISLTHASKETVSFRKLTSDGVVICRLKTTWQYFARAPEFENMTLLEFHSPVRVRVGKPLDEVARIDDDDPEPPPWLPGPLSHKREKLREDFTPLDEAADAQPAGVGEDRDVPDEGDARDHDSDDEDDEDDDAPGARRTDS
jgi:hypothetical protein